MNKIKSFIFNLIEKNLGFFTKMGINKKTPGVSAIYNVLQKIFWPYESIVDVQGSRMYVNPENSPDNLRRTLEEYAVNRIHEKETTDLFKKTINKGDVFVDLGANIGYFTLLASRLVGKSGKVFSFEPEPNNFRYLNKNIAINDYSQAQAFQKAVSNKNGKTKLFFCTYDSGHHTINNYEGIEAYGRGRDSKEIALDIETVALDSFLKGKTDKVNVIKMDVEGAEFLALEGMDEILRKNKNIKMFIEFFPLLIEKMGSSPEKFIKKLLEEFRFSIYVIPEDYAAGEGGLKKIYSVDEAMNYRKNEEDHINLFLKRE